jgi:Glycine zipper
LSRRYNVDLTSTKRVVDQIDTARDFAFIAPELRNEGKLASLQENIFAMQVDDDSTSELGSEADSIRRLAPHLSVDPTVLRMMVDGGRFSGTAFGSGNVGGAAATPIVVNKGLHFRLHKVKCIDETNPEWPGDYEIAMGGTAVPPTGNPTKVPEFMVRDDFDDGESKTYSPPRLLKTFSMTNVSYPADFLMVLALAEKDNGGLSSFLQDLREAIKDEVTVIIAAVGAAAGAAAGGALGTAIGGPLGTIIGAVAGAILGALIGWLISAIKDDIFTPQSAAVQLPKSNSTFAGGALTSPQLTMDFRDHGGHYRAWYTWQLVR